MLILQSIKNSALSIKKCTPSPLFITPPTSRIEIRDMKSEIGYPHTNSNLQPPTSDLQPPTSNLRPPTSDLRYPTSDFRPPTSNLRPPTSNLRLPTSDLHYYGEQIKRQISLVQHLVAKNFIVITHVASSYR